MSSDPSHDGFFAESQRRAQAHLELTSDGDIRPGSGAESTLPAPARTFDGSEASLHRVYDIAFRVARSRFRATVDEAEDVAQEMMLRAFKRLPSAPVTVAWVVYGARFLCIDRHRARKSEVLALEHYSRRPPPAVDGVELSTALSSLPCQCRQLIQLYFWEGRTWAEIDDLLAEGHRCAQYRTKKCIERLSRMFCGGART